MHVRTHAGLLFFTTYTLLVLFWAEIYHQARSMPTGALRPIFLALNAVVYSVQVRCALLIAGCGLVLAACERGEGQPSTFPSCCPPSFP